MNMYMFWTSKGAHSCKSEPKVNDNWAKKRFAHKIPQIIPHEVFLTSRWDPLWGIDPASQKLPCGNSCHAAKFILNWPTGEAIRLRFCGALCDFKSRDFIAIWDCCDCDFAIWASKGFINDGLGSVIPSRGNSKRGRTQKHAKEQKRAH